MTYRAALRRVPSGGRVQVVARCRARETAVDASHAVAFRTPAPPTRAVIDSVTASHRVAPDACGRHCDRDDAAAGAACARSSR